MNKETLFHQSREMFYIDDQRIVTAPMGDTRGHKEWFEAINVPFESTPRGFYKNGAVYVYQGSSFNLPNMRVSVVLLLLHRFQSTVIHFGMRVGDVGTIWEPMFTMHLTGSM